MTTLDQIAYNLLNKIEGGRSHHNTYYSLDQIKYNIENYRALFLRRDMRDSHDLRSFEQKIDLSVRRVSFTNEYKSARYGLESIETLPSLIRLKYQIPLFITSVGRDETYPVMDHHAQRWHRYNKYTSVYPRAYTLNGKLYIVGDRISSMIERLVNEGVPMDENHLLRDIINIEVYGVFEKPTDVMMINGVSPTDIGSQSYPITLDFVQRITEGMINGELQMLMQSPSDTRHDSLPDHQVDR